MCVYVCVYLFLLWIYSFVSIWSNQSFVVKCMFLLTCFNFFRIINKNMFELCEVYQEFMFLYERHRTNPFQIDHQPWFLWTAKAKQRKSSLCMLSSIFSLYHIWWWFPYITLNKATELWIFISLFLFFFLCRIPSSIVYNESILKWMTVCLSCCVVFFYSLHIVHCIYIRYGEQSVYSVLCLAMQNI